MSPLLEVRDLTVQLKMDSGPREVITGTSLTIAQGESMGLVGESGSGKSMTAKAITGLLPPGVTATGTMRLPGSAGPTESSSIVRSSDVGRRTRSAMLGASA